MYAFSPYHFIHANQIGLTTIQWIPLFLMAVREYCGNRRLRQGLWIILSAWLVAASDPYTFVYFLVFYIVYLAFYERRIALGLLAILPVLAGPFYIPLGISLSAMKGAADLTVEAITYSQDLMKYFIPWKFHPVWGRFFGNFFPGDRLIEMFLGYVPLFLTIFAVRKLFSPSPVNLKGKAGPPSSEALQGVREGEKDLIHLRFWFIFGIIALILSLGPYLKINGYTGIPMPYWVIWKIPFLSYLRMPQRFGLEVSLALSVLSAYGLKEIFSYVKSRGPKTVLAASLLIGIGLEYLVYFPFPYSSARIPRIYTFMKNELASEPGALLELPLGNEDDIYRYMYYQTKYGRPLVNGGLPRDPDWAHDFQDDVPFLQEIGDPLNLSKGDILPGVSLTSGVSILAKYLQRNSIPLLVVHRQAYSGTGVEDALDKVLGHPFFEDADVAGFTVRTFSTLSLRGEGGVRGPILILGKGWHELRYTNDKPFRWMKGKGDVRVIGNPRKERVKLKVFIIREFPGAKTLRVFVNGKYLEDIDISGIPYDGSVLTKSFLLPQGDSSVFFSVVEGPFSPYEEKGIPDPRRISIGVSHLDVLFTR